MDGQDTRDSKCGWCGFPLGPGLPDGQVEGRDDTGAPICWYCVEWYKGKCEPYAAQMEDDNDY